MKHLQDRLHKLQTKALLGTVAQRLPAAVVMLDLANEMLAGATMEDVSTVLYFKVLQWAGYSRNLKVAAFERMVEKDNRTAELHAKVAAPSVEGTVRKPPAARLFARGSHADPAAATSHPGLPVR